MGHSETSHNHIETDLAKYEKFKWMLTAEGAPLIINKILGISNDEHTHIPNFEEFHDNTLSSTDKLNFVLLALEKMHHVHPSAIDPRDSKYLHPTRTGILLKSYYVGLYLPFVYGASKVIVSRSFSAKNVYALVAYTAAWKLFLEPAPFVAKEWIRRVRNRKVALKYFERQKGKLDVFRKILDPRTDHHYLHHLEL